MKSSKEINERIKEDRDYEYVGISDDPGWAIRLLTGTYDQAIIHYTKIKLVPITNNKGENVEQETTLSFDYNVLNPTVLPEGELEPDLGSYLGDVLMVAIQTGLDNGTATIDDGQSQQDYPTITLD